MDDIDRSVINRLQLGFPISASPFAEVAGELGIAEQTLLERLQGMLESRTLTRFGPMYHAERLGGGLSLCAMRIPAVEFERVAEQVNGFPEVAHNYARDHEFNMWFVLATETPERIQQVLDEITALTGYTVYNMPKQEEFFVGLRFEV